MMNNCPDSLLEDLFQAYYDARENKRNTKSQLSFELNMETNMMNLYQEVKERSYRQQRGICFIVDHPVKREIFASRFRDRVIHHLIFNYLAPIFENLFLYDSYSCRKGKGTTMGVKRLKHHILSCTNNYKYDAYILKLDLKGYFMSICKQKLYDIIYDTLVKHWKSQTKDYDTLPPGSNPRNQDFILYLLQTIIFNDPSANCEMRSSPSDWDGLPPSKSLLNAPQGYGLPIGDLTSQLFSNIYLHSLDMYAKHTLKLKHYGRYVDDFYVVHHNKWYLKGLIEKFRIFLKEELELTLHPNKTYLQHYTKGVTFLGVVIKPYRTYTCHRTIRHFNQTIDWAEMLCKKKNVTNEELTRIELTINSYCGYLRQHKSFNILKRRFHTSPLFNYFYFGKGYSKIIRRKTNKPRE